MEAGPSDDDPQVRLLERVRGLLHGEPDVREITMFGELAVMVNDSMLVAVGRTGDLLVRVDRTRTPHLLTRPGAARAVMGPGRVMGPSWLRVEAVALDDDAELAFWITVALERNRANRG